MPAAICFNILSKMAYLLAVTVVSCTHSDNAILRIVGLSVDGMDITVVLIPLLFADNGVGV